MTHIKVGDIVKFGQGTDFEGYGIVLGVRTGVLGGTGTTSWRSSTSGQWMWQQLVIPRADEILVHGLSCDAYGWYDSSNLELVSSADDGVLL